MDTTEKTNGTETFDRAVRVRYSRLGKDDRTPKNTLVTVRDGNSVYFGIARCNRKMDVFHKSVGTYIASQRAELVGEEEGRNYNTHIGVNGASFMLHKSGLRGVTQLENIKEVVNYFYTVDDYCLDLSRETTETVGV